MAVCSVTHINQSINQPSVFVCPLFREFRELNKIAKLKGVNIDTVPTLIGITHVLELFGLNLPK